MQQMVSASIYICTPLAIECGVLKTFIKILAQQILHYDFFWQIKKKKIISIFIDEQNLHQMIEWMLLLSKYNTSRWWKNLMLVFLRKNKTESNHHLRHNPRISENLPINNETSQVSRQKLNVCHISHPTGSEGERSLLFWKKRLAMFTTISGAGWHPSIQRTKANFSKDKRSLLLSENH